MCALFQKRLDFVACELGAEVQTLLRDRLLLGLNGQSHSLKADVHSTPELSRTAKRFRLE